jgi:hypothetical protein
MKTKKTLKPGRTGSADAALALFKAGRGAKEKMP